MEATRNTLEMVSTWYERSVQAVFVGFIAADRCRMTREQTYKQQAVASNKYKWL